MIRSLTGLACAAMLAVAPLQAQDEEPRRGGPGPSLTPYVGFHHALGTLLTEEESGEGRRAKTGLLLGGRLEFPLGRRTGVQIDVGYATPKIEAFGSGAPTSELDGRFLSLTARVARHLTAPPGPMARGIGVSVHAGGGLMQHWISAPRPIRSTWPSGVAGLTLRLPRTLGLTPFLLGEVHVYSAKFEGGVTRRALQQDLRVSVGAWLPGN